MSRRRSPCRTAVLGGEGGHRGGVAELDRTGEAVQPGDPHEQHRPAADGVEQVRAPPGPGVVVAAVDDQRVGGDGQQLVEEQEGHEVAGQGDRRRWR
jgi:hypothetical protein